MVYELALSFKLGNVDGDDIFVNVAF